MNWRERTANGIGMGIAAACPTNRRARRSEMDWMNANMARYDEEGRCLWGTVAGGYENRLNRLNLEVVLRPSADKRNEAVGN